MIRHIFIAPVKEGVSEELLSRKMDELRSLKSKVPEVEALMVGKSLGWIGMEHAVVMVVELKDKSAFNALMQSQAHIEISQKADEAFDTSGFVASQVEF